MKKYAAMIFHFLGGITFAVILIGATAAMVITGTMIESKTDSHELAALWTYKHPFFIILLFSFFINILTSSLRRWPFQKKHLPFLITHLGLLMIILGIFIKNQFGLQGQLSVWEGSGNQNVTIPQTYALRVDQKEERKQSEVALSSLSPHLLKNKELPNISFKVLHSIPHVKKQLASWIKGSHLRIIGLPLLKVFPWAPNLPFPSGESLRVSWSHPDPWKIIAIETIHTDEAIKTAYLDELVLKMKGKTTYEIPLKKALETPFIFENQKWELLLDLKNPSLTLKNKNESLRIQLKGQNSLEIQHPIRQSIEIDLIRPHPLLTFLKNDKGSCQLIACDSHGRIHQQNLEEENLKTYTAYEEGFEGYATQISIPIPNFPSGRKDKQAAQAYALANQLREMSANAPHLTPPISWFKKECEKLSLDFSTTFVEFLFDWKNSGEIFANHSTSKNITKMDWNSVPLCDQKGAEWIISIINQIDPLLRQGEELHSILERLEWPFPLMIGNDSPLLTYTQQIFSLSPSLPSLPNKQEKISTLFSAYLTGYGIDYDTFLKTPDHEEESFDLLKNYWKTDPLHPFKELVEVVQLETPLTTRLIPEPPPIKIEDRVPGILLEIRQGTKKERIALCYDSTSSGLKWPILNGQYLIRFQPQEKEIPYRIRLRQARQFNYADSNQPYSYECDVLIQHTKQPTQAAILSMNQVYETTDGYRFYLSGIGTSADQSLKRVQFAVNKDPAKYILTYPGGFFVCLGAFFLFWRVRKKKE